MSKFLDYEQVEEKLQEILRKSNGFIKQEILAVTECGLPIEHYTIGTGKKELIITGATHGCEIITTDYILELMDKIATERESFDLDEYTLHIVPMLNPEGYSISTDAARVLIPREMDEEEATEVCNQYYKAFRQDDTDAINWNKEHSPDRDSVKKYQQMFIDAHGTLECIKNEKIREKIKKIFEAYPDIPLGSLLTWSSNANGIDIQANVPYNPMVNRIMNGAKEIYKDNLRYGNLDCSHPGPINCPYDVNKGQFTLEVETKAIMQLINDVNARGNLIGYFNMHSTQGAIYQRPAKNGNGVVISDEMYWGILTNNIFKTLLYQDKTIRGYNNFGKPNQEEQKYTVLKGSAVPTTLNDLIRMKIPSDFLVEFSGMGGNPIAPYGNAFELNPKTTLKFDNRKLAINSNIDAFKYYLKYYNLIDKVVEGAKNALKHRFEVYKSTLDEIERENLIYHPRKKDEIVEDKYKYEVDNNEYLGTVYNIAEVMMREVKQYIEAGKEDELLELLQHGFFVNGSSDDKNNAKSDGETHNDSDVGER